jgi:hypothetical protein
VVPFELYREMEVCRDIPSGWRLFVGRGGTRCGGCKLALQGFYLYILQEQKATHFEVYKWRKWE